MAEGTLVLLHSPLTSATAWGDLPAALRRRGAKVVVPDVYDDDRPPFSSRYVARASLQVGGRKPVVAVAHSGAGPLIGQFGYAQRAWKRRMAGYVFIDAGIPQPGGPSRLELMREEDPAFAAQLEDLFNRRGKYPRWSDRDFVNEIPDKAARKSLLDGVKERGARYFTEPVPCPLDWPDAPCGYIRTSPSYDVPMRTARSNGWPVIERAWGHFAPLINPEGLADDLVALVEEM